MSSKLEKVLEHLIANDEAKAKELLHQVFIEKARKIHEELMSQDELDEMEHMGGDEGEELEDAITHHNATLEADLEEIDAEETMSEDTEDMMDMSDTADVDVDVADSDGDIDMDMSMDSEMDSSMDVGSTMDDIEDELGDLKDSIEELRATLERIESGEESDEVEDSEVEDTEEESDEEDEVEDSEEEEESDEEDEEKMDESWLEEDFDDLAESVELEKVSVPASGEVGSGKGQGAPSEKAKSPVPASQTSRMGAKPVKVDTKSHSGYNKETAPSSKDMGLKNQRKSADAGMSSVSKEGDKAAALNKTASEFGADTVGKNSPLSKSPRK